jgi:hypothetical protein
MPAQHLDQPIERAILTFLFPFLRADLRRGRFQEDRNFGNYLPRAMRRADHHRNTKVADHHRNTKVMRIDTPHAHADENAENGNGSSASLPLILPRITNFVGRGC